MELARDIIPHTSRMGSAQASSSFSTNSFMQVSDFSALFGTDSSEKTGTGFAKNFTLMGHSSSLSGPSTSSKSSELVFQPADDDAPNSLINFKAGYDNFMQYSNGNGSFLNFKQNDCCLRIDSQREDEEYSIWEDNLDGHDDEFQGSWSQNFNPKGTANSLLFEEFNTFQANESQHRPEETSSFHHKRPHAGEDMQALKKHCGGTTGRRTKPKSIPSKDPQSIAAKNRRERISERLKILQDLVPNGSKVDLVTMLEKAISYVKFLQLQVKVLATDEFWPVQGGKAPDISQVKEAIDAILSSQRDRKSSSSASQRPSRVEK